MRQPEPSARRRSKGVLIAIAAAACFSLAPAASSAGETVRCHGVNQCRGHGACATANNQCRGQNSCRGQGVLEIERADCEARGGQIDA